MSRPSLTTALHAAVNAAETDECATLLIEVDHPALAVPIRVNNSGVDLTSNGDLYQAFPFTVILPEDDGQVNPQPQLQIDNIDRTIIQNILLMGQVAATATFTLVLASAPDVVQMQIVGFTLRNVTYDAMTVQGILTIEDYVSEPLGTQFTPGSFPGLFS